jgi:hypothetical protein
MLSSIVFLKSFDFSSDCRICSLQPHQSLVNVWIKVQSYIKITIMKGGLFFQIIYGLN